MTEFKPSTLPVGTVIAVEDVRYSKDISDGGHTFWDPGFFSDGTKLPTVSDDSADAQFEEFDIISVPWATAVQMAILLQDEYGYQDSEGEDITITGLIKQSLDATVEFQEKESVVKRLDDIREAIIEAAK